MKTWREVAISLGIAIALAVFLRTFVISVYKIPSSSMQPTLLAGDFVLAYKLPYGFRLPISENKILVAKQPRRGEIFVFKFSKASDVKYIKRVVALAGDKVEIKEDRLFINDIEANYKDLGIYPGSGYLSLKQESLLGDLRQIVIMQKERPSSFGPVFVPEDSVFVLGDNRDSSDDSRYWGVVSLNDIESKVFGIWLSLNLKSKSDQDVFLDIRWSRMFQWL